MKRMGRTDQHRIHFHIANQLAIIFEKFGLIAPFLKQGLCLTFIGIGHTDNLYGTVQEYGKNGRPKADWYPSWYPSWGSTGHGYEDLEESDMANFQFIDVDAQGNRTPVANFNLDYFSTIDDSGNPILHPDDTENPLPAFIAPQDFRTSWHWNMQESNVADGDNNLEESPTLATDFVDTTDEYGVYAHPDNGWIYNMIFEFKVDGDLFSGEQDFNVVIGTSHNSPVKIDGGGTIIIVPDGELPPPPGDGSPPVSYEDNVPEPATMSLLVLGGIAILTRRKR